MGIEIKRNELGESIKRIIEKLEYLAQQFYEKHFEELSYEQREFVIEKVKKIIETPIDPNGLTDTEKLTQGFYEELAQNLYEKPYKELSLKQQLFVLETASS